MLDPSGDFFKISDTVFSSPKIWFLFSVSFLLLRFHMCSLIMIILFLMSLSIITIAALKFLSANTNIHVILESVSINCTSLMTMGHIFLFPCMSSNFELYPEHCTCYVNL